MKKLIFLAITLPLIFTACNTELIEPEPDPVVKPEPTPEPTPTPVPSADGYRTVELTSTQLQALDTQNDFGFDVFNGLVANKSEGNVIYSPLSMHVLLSMMANGTSGEVLDEITSALGVRSGDDGLQELNEFYQMLVSEIEEMDCEFTLANGGFSTESEVAPKGTFLSEIAKWYGAEYITATDNTDLHNKVNAWVNAKTKGMISEFPIFQGTKSILLNTMYFAAKWKTGMKEVKGSENSFKNADNTTSYPAFIEGEAEESYSYGDFDVINKYLGVRGKNQTKFTNFRLELILPKEGVDIDKFVMAFDPKVLISPSSEYMNKTIPVLTMPKFSSSYENISMSQILKAAGIKRLFTARQGDEELSGLTDAGFYVNDIVQKTSLEVDETGLKASAASGTGGMIGIVDYKYFTLNRPFMFVLRETSTNVVLMTGIIRKL